MSRYTTYMLVATMAVSGAGFALAADPANMPNTGANNGTQLQQPLSGQQADESTQKEVRSTLADVVNDAVTPNKFAKVIDYLAKPDRDRLADSKNANADDLNKTINQFRSDFKSKYKQDFDMSSDQLKDAQIYAGQDKKSATALIPNPELNSTGYTPGQLNNGINNAANTGAGAGGATADRTLNTGPDQTTVSNRSGAMSGSAVGDAGKATGPASSGANSNSTVRGNDVNANPGVAPANNNMASSTPPANAALASAATLNLVNEGHILNAWRINIPSEITGDQLKQNMIKHIQMLDDQKSTWPSDVNAAYKATAYHILQSFNDTSLASER